MSDSPGVHVNSPSGGPGPAIERSQHFLSLKGWSPWAGEGLPGRGQGWGPLQWLLINGSGTPCSTQKGVEISGTPHPAEACVTVNSDGWHGPHRLLYDVHRCRFQSFACSSVSKINRSVVIRIHCFQGTHWVTSLPIRREHCRFKKFDMKVFCCFFLLFIKKTFLV